MKYRLKDSVRTYIIEFIVIFSCLSIMYICLHRTTNFDLDACIREYGLDSCNVAINEE